VPTERQSLVTKSEFARLKSRTPTTVHRWVRGGKISPEAVVNDRIWVERANRDLAANLCPSQQAAQARPIAPEVYPASRSNDFARRAKAIADRAEQDAIAAARRNAIENGKWLDAAEAAKVWQRELGRVIAETEAFLFTTLARELADKYSLDWHVLSLDIRNLLRAHRAA
jgi:hypothetical protein